MEDLDIDHATKKGNYVASLSLQVLDESQVKSLDELLIQICLTAAEKCEIPFDEYTEKLDKIWETKLFKSKKKCDSFFEKYLLPKIDKPLVLVLDEVDRIFKSPEVSLEFFSLLRVWNDQAKTPGKEIFKKLKLVLAYSTEIYLAIPDINQSPFNIGLKIEPCEFTREEVNTLANKHGIQLSAGQLAKLYELIGGHPFLVRKALYHLACEDDASFDGLITNAAAEGGYFEDHLKRHLWNLSRKDNLLKGMKEVIKYEKATSYEVASRLQSAGLVVIKTPEVNINGGVDKKVTVKNKLYKDYFDNHID